MGEITAKADEASRHDAVDRALRFGLVVYGVVHLVFGWLAAQLALGGSSEEASSTGALQELAEQPLGAIVLWLIAAGMALLVLVQVLDVAVGHRGEDGTELGRHRAVDLGKAVIYAVLAYSAISTATGSSSGSSDESSQGLTARIMQVPAGQVLVGVIGLGVLAVGIVLVWRGVTDEHMKKLDASAHRHPGSPAYRLLGKVGCVAKGLTIGIVGILFVVSAVQHDPSESGGTDQALRQLQDQPFGSYLLLAMGLGIASFGLFCFARARHLAR